MEKGSQTFSPKSNQMATKSNASQIRPSKKTTVYYDDLDNRERDVFNLALYFPDLHELIQRAQANTNNGRNYLNLWESYMARSIVP